MEKSEEEFCFCYLESFPTKSEFKKHKATLEHVKNKCAYNKAWTEWREYLEENGKNMDTPYPNQASYMFKDCIFKIDTENVGKTVSTIEELLRI